jgi:hypothetical protein
MLPPAAVALKMACLDKKHLTVSQQVGEFLIDHGIEGLCYPSAVFKSNDPAISDKNIVIYLPNASKEPWIPNLTEILAKFEAKFGK